MILSLLVAAASADEMQLSACEFWQPIGGTAGFANGLAAIRTNAQTYGAGAFARERLRGDDVLALDMHVVVGAAQVPVWCSDTTGKHAQSVYSQPLDVGATNLGLAIPLIQDGPLNLRARVFYASSVAQAVMGARALSWSMPLLNLYPAVAAPVIGRSSTGRGLTMYAVDWIGGGYLASDIVSVQAGYTGTRGLYVDVTQEKVALFFNTVLGDGVSLSDAQYLVGGVQQFDVEQLGADDPGFGLVSLFYRDLPQADADEEVGGGAGLVDRLQTGHFRQEDMFGRYDLRAAWQFGAQGRLRELAVAYHTEGWYQREHRERQEERLFYARAGIVNLPDQPTLGVRGGVRPTARLDYIYDVGTTETLALRASFQYNDPDLLDLYPFAYNALGVHVELTMSLDD